jgi:hypothetical protein
MKKMSEIKKKRKLKKLEKMRKIKKLNDFRGYLTEIEWADSGELSKESIIEIEKGIEVLVKKIEKSEPGDEANLYSLIHRLGKTGMNHIDPIPYKKLIESFLFYPTAPMISAIALRTLCNYWECTEQYLDKVILFVKGVEWDKDEQVRLIAMSIAGRFCRHKPNQELFESLIDVFENPWEDNFMRSLAY